MEHVAKFARRVLSNESTQQPQPAKLPRQIIDRIWTRMAEIYGHKWTSNFGDHDHDDTWARALADLSNDDLKRGLAGCLYRPDAWPPSLPEFRALCKPEKRENEAMYRFPPSRQLPHKLSDEDRQKGRSAIVGLKALVRQ